MHSTRITQVFVRLSSCVLFLVCFTACQAANGFVASERADYGEASRAAADVTNGLVAGQLAADPEGSIRLDRGRSLEGAKFVDTDDDGLPDAREAAAPRERMLVYTGQVAVEVPRAEEAGAAFLTQVQQWGGYLQSQSGTTFTVRLPAQHFEAAFAAVRAMGRVLTEQRQANDVTEEFVDLGIRLDNAKRSRDRLLEILQKAEKVEDILKVEVELRRLTAEIERMEGRVKFLKDQVAMATLEAGFRPASTPPPSTRVRRSRFPWMRRIGADAVMEGF